MRNNTKEKIAILGMMVMGLVIALLLTWRLVSADSPTPDPNVGGGYSDPMWQPVIVPTPDPMVCRYYLTTAGWQMNCEFNRPLVYYFPVCPSNIGYYGGYNVDCGYPDFTQEQLDHQRQSQMDATIRYETEQADWSGVITPVSTQLAPAVVPTVQAVFPWQDGWRLLP